MTLEFAKSEAKRRTDVLGTIHLVCESVNLPNEFMVLPVDAVVHRSLRIVDYFSPDSL